MRPAEAALEDASYADLLRGLAAVRNYALAVFFIVLTGGVFLLH